MYEYLDLSEDVSEDEAMDLSEDAETFQLVDYMPEETFRHIFEGQHYTTVIDATEAFAAVINGEDIDRAIERHSCYGSSNAFTFMVQMLRDMPRPKMSFDQIQFVFRKMSIKLAIKKKDICTLKALYRQGIDLRCPNYKALRFACRKNNLPAVKFLINVCNANVNSHEYRKYKTYNWNIIYNHPMTSACENNNMEMMQYLHSKGGDVHVFNDECLRIAVRNLNFEIMKWLLEEHNLSLTKRLDKYTCDTIGALPDGVIRNEKGIHIMNYLIKEHKLWKTHPSTALEFSIKRNDKKLFCDIISKRWYYSPEDLDWPLYCSISKDVFFMEKLFQMGAHVRFLDTVVDDNLDDEYFNNDFEDELCKHDRIEHVKIISRYWSFNLMKEKNFSIGWNCPKIHIYIKQMEEKHVEELTALFDYKLPFDIIKNICKFLFKPVMELVDEDKVENPEFYT